MIYFIQDSASHNIKIGFTSAEDADGRRAALQTGNSAELVLLRTIPGGKRITEATLHRRFAKDRVAGEWFRPSPDLLRFIIEWKPYPDPVPWPATIYLAGKIYQGDWRSSIVDEAWNDNDEMHGVNFLSEDYWSDNVAPPLPSEWPVIANAIFGTHHYSGPFFMSGQHTCYHGEDEHGVSASMNQEREYICGHSKTPPGIECVMCGNGKAHQCDGVATSTVPRGPLVSRLCSDAISRSSIVFAWIDELDCYGTISEIGYAAALGKEIWIAGPRLYRDMWFVYQYASVRRCPTPLTPRDVLQSMLSDKENSSRAGV